MYKQGFFLTDIIEEQLLEGGIDKYPDPEGPARINHRGKLKEWKDNARPTKLTGWLPAHVIFGHEDIEMPDNAKVE